MTNEQIKELDQLITNIRNQIVYQLNKRGYKQIALSVTIITGVVFSYLMDFVLQLFANHRPMTIELFILTGAGLSGLVLLLYINNYVDNQTITSTNKKAESIKSLIELQQEIKLKELQNELSTTHHQKLYSLREQMIPDTWHKITGIYTGEYKPDKRDDWELLTSSLSKSIQNMDTILLERSVNEDINTLIETQTKQRKAIELMIEKIELLDKKLIIIGNDLEKIECRLKEQQEPSNYEPLEGKISDKGLNNIV